MSANGPDDFDALERAMGHSFRGRALLRQALTHASYANDAEDVEDNETLEFLGDGLLNFLVAELLFHAFPLEGEGALSKARSLLVFEGHFAALARRVGLGPLLRLAPGEERAGGRERDARLADAFEAALAALLLDGGIEAARAAASRLFADDISALDLAMLTRRDPKTALQERAQAEGRSPVYRLVEESGPPHDPRFVYEVSIGAEISGRGVGSSKKDAQRNAADAALRELEKK
ncbi:MAG: ribonuclease III [Acidobacteriota bacterium]